MNYKGYLIDLDGTIYLGTKPIPEAKTFVEELQNRKIPFLFVTNNTTKSPADVKENLATGFDIHVTEEEVYTASLATVDYMLDKGLGNKVYILGEEGLKNEILKAGFIHETINPDYVVVGLDRELSYDKLKIATLAIRNGAHFIGTNPDKNLPTDEGLVPGAGSLLALVETATNQKATVIGKPNAIIMEKALERLSLSKEEVIMVGDNYETDILAGINNQIDTLLVLTGFTPKDAVPTLEKQPTFVCESLAEWNFNG